MLPRPPPRFDPLTHPDIVDNIVPYLLLINNNPRFLARAAIINKAWNTLYSPFLWRNIRVDNNNFATVPESLQRYGIYYFKATLRSVSLDMMTFPPEDIVSALLGDAGGGGGEGYLKLKKFRLALDPAFRDTKNLRWDTVVSLMEAYAHMDRIYLANIHILDPVVTGDHDQDQDHQIATTEEFKDASYCHALRHIRPLEQQLTMTAITYLNFSRVEMDDRRVIDILTKTPHLTSFCITHNKTVQGDFLGALPMLCPEVRQLNVTCCDSIPSSAFSQFFQSLVAGSHYNQPQQQQQDGPCLQLKRLHLIRCKLDDRCLEHLALSLASTLLHFFLWKCSGVTDSGVKSVLSRCHRLESLTLLEVDGLTLAIMTDDSDVKNNNDTDLGSTLLMTSQQERQKWACYRTLKQLDIRGLGLRRAGYDFLGADSPQNRAVFRRIRQRVRMLPALERLAVSVWGADEELLQGFMGIEEEDQRHQLRQLTMGENGEGEVSNENADQTEAEATAAVPTPTADGAASGGAGSPHHHQNQHNNQQARTLVGPCLRLLKVRGQQGKTFIGSDLERFIRNYPGLRELYTSTIVLDKEAVERLWEAGIEGQSTKPLNIPQTEDN
ncbi:hypothetical protein K457DRAFT_37088 [Linnemannia elongata AG-77]|uniref:RNI-like protein n=1 Tax=Linnemannia elongata AG-77 TaxID=1314771 RepID=A0A197JC90_9FUNG|nr:hypothetical protein K457DRAFT_37088 [Linnemannia elongata AG-77]